MPEPECEFKKFCDSIGYTHPCEKDRKEIAYCAVRITLNSPQFTKQYAKREDLVEAVEEGPWDELEDLVELIRTHGLKEEE